MEFIINLSIHLVNQVLTAPSFHLKHLQKKVFPLFLNGIHFNELAEFLMVVLSTQLNEVVSLEGKFAEVLGTLVVEAGLSDVVLDFDVLQAYLSLVLFSILKCEASPLNFAHLKNSCGTPVCLPIYYFE